VRIASFRIVKVPNGFRSNTRGCYKQTPKSNSLANKAYIKELQKSGCLVVKHFKSRPLWSQVMFLPLGHKLYFVNLKEKNFYLKFTYANGF